MKEFGFYANGEWRQEGEKRDIRSPYTGEVIGRMTRCNSEGLASAITEAEKAFCEFRKCPSWRRREYLLKIAEGISNRREELASIITGEAGKPIRFSRGEVDRAVQTFTCAAEEASRIYGELMPLDVSAVSEGRFGITRRFPIGVVAGITPFNFPLNLVAHKVAPAIAAGNAILLRPASQTPLSSLTLAEIAEAAGLPPGILNVVPCSTSTASVILDDPRIKKLSFTGSAEVGWELKRKCFKKKVTLELGGNAAAIVEPDADMDFALERLPVGAFAYAGQVCISVQRIYINESIFDEFSRRFVEMVQEKIKAGNPGDEDVVVGPMIDSGSADRVMSWIQEAVASGAKVLCGNEREANVIQPTVLTNVPRDAKISALEAFGPVVVIEPYPDFETALGWVNDSRYGLQAGVFTRDMGKILRAFHTLEVGGIIINDFPTFRVDPMPYGGVKDSGFGREGLRYAIEEMTELRLMVMR